MYGPIDYQTDLCLILWLFLYAVCAPSQYLLLVSHRSVAILSMFSKVLIMFSTPYFSFSTPFHLVLYRVKWSELISVGGASQRGACLPLPNFGRSYFSGM